MYPSLAGQRWQRRKKRTQSSLRNSDAEFRPPSATLQGFVGDRCVLGAIDMSCMPFSGDCQFSVPPCWAASILLKFLIGVSDMMCVWRTTRRHALETNHTPTAGKHACGQRSGIVTVGLRDESSHMGAYPFLLGSEQRNHAG